MVNAHTHLELSDLRGKLRARPGHFTDWLKHIVTHGRKTSAKDRAVAACAGAAESLASGVTAAAEISYAGAGSAALAGSPLRTTCFVEVYGHSRSQIDKSLAAAATQAETLSLDSGLQVGLSPHAPYSAGIKAYLAAAQEAESRGWPITTHLHETPGEVELYERGSGEFKHWLLLRWALALSGFKPPKTSPIKALTMAGFFSRPVLVGHGNYLDDEEIAILAESGSTVAFCPRSHDYFGHTDHPYRRLMAAGVAVALGTDSLASSPSLSVLDEMRFLREHDGDLPPHELLAMGTCVGADALGLGGQTGRLAIGEWADVAAVAVSSSAAADPHETVLQRSARVVGTWVAGQRVFGQ
jgi:cytosine/adenosine deaminase-related metal-dependent hydrolase